MVLNVCYWHNSDIDFDVNMSAIEGKADISDRLADVG